MSEYKLLRYDRESFTLDAHLAALEDGKPSRAEYVHGAYHDTLGLQVGIHWYWFNKELHPAPYLAQSGKVVPGLPHRLELLAVEREVVFSWALGRIQTLMSNSSIQTQWAQTQAGWSGGHAVLFPDGRPLWEATPQEIEALLEEEILSMEPLKPLTLPDPKEVGVTLFGYGEDSGDNVLENLRDWL